MSEQITDRDENFRGYFTYLEAAFFLDKSLESIQKAVSNGVLISHKLPGETAKVISAEQVEWYKDKPLTKEISKVYQEIQSLKNTIDVLSEQIEMYEKGMDKVPTRQAFAEDMDKLSILYNEARRWGGERMPDVAFFTSHHIQLMHILAIQEQNEILSHIRNAVVFPRKRG